MTPAPAVRPVLAVLGRLIYPVLSRVNDIVNGIWISPDADIGPRLFIAHYGGVVIGAATIGANCNIGNHTTIGKSGRGAGAGRPVLADRVVVAPSARVLGPLYIGADAMIGVNSVPITDVPDRRIPARLISYRTIRYRATRYSVTRCRLTTRWRGDAVLHVRRSPQCW